MKKRECVVFVPGLNEKKIFSIPDNMPFEECIRLMVELLKEDYPETHCKGNELSLYKASTGELLDKRYCWAELDITEQDEFILG